MTNEDYTPQMYLVTVTLSEYPAKNNVADSFGIRKFVSDDFDIDELSDWFTTNLHERIIDGNWDVAPDCECDCQ